MRSTLRALSILVAVGLPAAALAQDEEVAGATGKDLFLRYCASCHGADARGDGPVAPTLKDKPADLTQIAAARKGVFPTAEIVRIIDGREVAVAHGTREMPVWGKRFGEAVPPGPNAEAVRRGTAQLIADYLASIQAPARPGDATPP